MKPYERRQQTAFPYFKLASWDPLSLTFRDGRRAFSSEASAKAQATKPGSYRVSIVTADGRRDLQPFQVT